MQSKFPSTSSLFPISLKKIPFYLRSWLFPLFLFPSLLPSFFPSYFFPFSPLIPSLLPPFFPLSFLLSSPSFFSPLFFFLNDFLLSNTSVIYLYLLSWFYFSPPLPFFLLSFPPSMISRYSLLSFTLLAYSSVPLSSCSFPRHLCFRIWCK